MIISIHAPPRGATRLAKEYHTFQGFQFTPLREGRLATWRKSSCSRTYFNSRPSARGDFRRSAVVHDAVYFNSRPSARGDDFNIDIPEIHLPISIHAPPRGATLRLRSLLRHSDFNSRPSARGDEEWKGSSVNDG